jgi:hypothetical protein
MLLLSLWLTPTAAAGCRGEINDALDAWRALAVSVPASVTGIDPLAEKLPVLRAHEAIGEEIKNSRRTRARATLPSTIAHAEAWMDVNPDTRGIEAMKAAIEALGPACGLRG